MMMKRQTIERMVSTVAAVMVMAGLFAPAAMAEEVVRDHRDGSEEASPIVPDHRDDASTTTTIEEKAEEEPYKDPGIRQCDITPTPCEDAQDQEEQEEDSAPHEPQVVCIKAPCPGSSDSSAEQEEEEPYKDPGIRQCDLTPVECEDTEDQEEQEEEPYEDPGIRLCDITPVECEDTDESRDEEQANSSGTAEAGQTANGGTIHGGCAYEDYDYVEEVDACIPKVPFFEVVFGNAPWPDSVGGYVGLLGQFVGDVGTGAGFIVDQGLGYLGDTLVEFGEGGGPIGWAIQGVGYTLGFLGEAGGVVVSGVGQGVDAVVEGVGEAVDAIGDAAGAAYDEIASWF
jgi:hypothetical protein